MSAAKRAGKGKAGDATGVDVASRAGHGGAKGDSRTEKNFVPVEMIAQETLALLLTPMDEIEAIKFLPNESTPRFFVIRKKDAKIHVELSAELAQRAACLAWKQDYEEHVFTRDLQCITASTASPKIGLALDEELVCLASGFPLSPLRILQAASVLLRTRSTLSNPVADMLRLPSKSKERNKAAKELKKRFAAAIDSLNLQSGKLLDGRAIKIEAEFEAGKFEKDIALVAIETAKGFVIVQLREPTKAELSRSIMDAHPKVFAKIKASHSYWNKVWKKAGLEGLEDEVWRATP